MVTMASLASPRLFIPAGDKIPQWLPIDPLLSYRPISQHRRAVYISRKAHHVCVLGLAWDMPNTLLVRGGTFPPGWTETRMLTANLIEDYSAAEAKLVEYLATPAGQRDFEAPGILDRLREIFRLWDSGTFPRVADISDND